MATLQKERRKWARLVVKEKTTSYHYQTSHENGKIEEKTLLAEWMADGWSEELLNFGLTGITRLATLHGIKHSTNMHRTSIAYKDVGINECSR